MLGNIRRDIAHRRAAREKEALKKLEKGRRLSYIRMKRFKERKSAEEELKEQTGAELSAHEAATLALRERQQTERTLRSSRREAGLGMKVARGVSRTTKAVFVDLPAKAVRLGAKLEKGGKMRQILIGDTDFVLGTPKASKPQTGKPSKSLHGFVFGPSAKPPSPKTKDKSLDIFSIDKDILG